MRAIASHLVQLNPDIICLQEMFMAQERDVIRTILKNTPLIYGHYFPSKTIGSGLWTLSAYPIEEAHFYPYSRNGKWWKLTEGDWWVGKGVGLVRIRVDGQAVDVYNTHMVASYKSGNENLEDRRSQIDEFAEFVQHTSPKNIPVILAGDFNEKQEGSGYQQLQTLLPLVRLLDRNTELDHIFGLKSPHHFFSIKKPTIAISGSIHVGSKKIPLSDHTGYFTQIRITPKVH